MQRPSTLEVSFKHQEDSDKWWPLHAVTNFCIWPTDAIWHNIQFSFLPFTQSCFQGICSKTDIICYLLQPAGPCSCVWPEVCVCWRGWIWWAILALFYSLSLVHTELKFDENSFLMKCSMLCGCLNGRIWLLIFKMFAWFLGGVKVWVQIWDFLKLSKTGIWQIFWQALCAIRWQVSMSW